jgi:hypothetical protein
LPVERRKTMAVSESQRHELYARLEEVIGKEHAETIMSLLPPVGWADVATKSDLDAMESRINERIIRTALTVNIPTILAAVALSFTAVRLA